MNITTFTTPGGDTSRVGIPDRIAPGGTVKLLIYCHGVGGNHAEFALADYNNLRSWMNLNGWAFLESNAQGPTWGNDTARAYYRAAFDHVDARYDVTDVVLFGRSMGGIVSSWLYLNDTAISPLARGLILCSAVQDMEWAYDFSTSASVFRTQMQTAYGTTNRATTFAAITNHNPIGFSPATYTGKKVLFQSGTEDGIVAHTTNVAAQQARVASVLAVNGSDYLPGDHYVTRPRWAEHSAFMASAIPPPEPGPDPGPEPDGSGLSLTNGTPVTVSTTSGVPIVLH